MERIAHASLLKLDGSFAIGKSHAEARETLTIEDIAFTCLRENQGFVTSEGRFVNRLMATDIAFEAGQLSEEHYELIGGGELISENLWEYGGFGYSIERGYFKDRDESLKYY